MIGTCMSMDKIYIDLTQVWDQRNPWLADYINIPVDYVISPSKATMPLGSVVCFKAPLVSSRGKFNVTMSFLFSKLDTGML